MFRRRIFLTLLCGVMFPAARLRAEPPKLVVDSLDGPVTANEIAAFKTRAAAFVPPVDGANNVWVFGDAGKAIEACGLMYEVSHDRAILDRMIYLCDAALAGRDDLLPAKNGGQMPAWMGKIEPIWPSHRSEGVAEAGVEQGQVLAHIAYCARLILKNPGLANERIDDGDRHHFGATYHERALGYLQQCDHVIDAWILPHFVRASDHNHYYFPADANTYKPNEPAPWNQAWMVTNGLVRLTQCHLLLHDDPQRVAKYDAIVKPNIEWFLASMKPQLSPRGTPCWKWLYSLASPNYVEDTNHAAYDSEGVWIAFDSGRYGLTAKDVMPLANTYVDIVLATVRDGKFAGQVDGHTGTGHRGGDNYVRDEYLYLAEFRPDAYHQMGEAEIRSGRAANSLPIDARLLWEKNRRAQGKVGSTQ